MRRVKRQSRRTNGDNSNVRLGFHFDDPFVADRTAVLLYLRQQNACQDYSPYYLHVLTPLRAWRIESMTTKRPGPQES